MALANQKNKILGQFLKSRRERMNPDRVEMASRFGRRRTPGLRREEVAQLAGVSITWYTWLEQGRVAFVSREVIDAVSRALQLSAEEYAHLLRLANYEGAADAKPSEVDVNLDLQPLIDQLDYPSIIANHRTEVLAYNRMANEVIADFDAMLPEDRVMTRLLFADPNMNEQLVNRDEVRDYTIGVFRMNHDQKPDDLWFDAFVREMCLRSEEFEQKWRLHDVRQKQAIMFAFDHAELGRLDFQLNSFSNINGNPDLHCCIFAPVAGTDTPRKIAALRSSAR
ncbi:helix-turn-helix transcriptional regulator [Paenibacillus methanolicus]|uniref:Helix-turn-helix protein n=1 Tax=Paenibacillus methanolicus TaxID=582686 RepID=A0A5S5CHE8_9BACL|nr:helix-turn-helix transcriptional regulator [Paenibacillus methanolicus]TYP79219.1 helix-turn-helix protein [Paenibacillus methanolicus]